MAFNEQLPQWENEGTEPPLSKRNQGWQPNEKPPASWFNWLFGRTYKALSELQSKAAEKTEVQQVEQTANNAASAAAAAQSTINTHTASTSAHGATSAATPNRIVLRDANGNISIGDATSDAHALNRATADGRYVGRRTTTLWTGTYDDLDVTSVDYVICNTSAGDITINSVLPASGHRVRFVKINTAGKLIIKQNESANMYMSGGVDLILRAAEKYGFAELQCNGNNWYGTVTSFSGSEEYDLPLAGGMVNLKTVLSSHDCKIYRVGNLAILVFALTKSTGNFSSSETIATLPSGLRPPVVMTILGRMIYVTSPTNTGGTYLGACEVNVNTNGNVVVYPADFQGNRVMGTVAYTIT